MKSRFIFVISIALLAISCNKSTTPGGDVPATVDPSPAPLKVGNCAMFTDPGEYVLEASENAESASLVWQTMKGFVSSLKVDKNLLTVTLASRGANALIAEKDQDGKIIRTVHLWSPEFLFTEVDLTEVNLGAITTSGIGSYGLLYQWGRAVPFPGSPIMDGGTTSTLPVPVYDMEGNEVAITHSSWTSANDNTQEYALQHPTEVLSCWSTDSKADWLQTSDDSLWGATKTAADPCPNGYRVASKETFQYASQYVQGEVSGSAITWKTAFGNVEELPIKDINGDGVVGPADYNCGWTINNSYFPAASRYDGQYAMLMGSMVGLWGNWWTCDPSENGTAIAFAYQVKDMSGKELYSFSPNGSARRADAYSIRCVKY